MRNYLPVIMGRRPYPGPWNARTWTRDPISGLWTNVPVAGDEILADPSLEAAYVAGKCASLNAIGTPTYTESADVHSGAKAQQFTADAQYEGVNYTMPGTGPASGTWLRSAVWAKRVAGAGGGVQVKTYFSGTPTIAGNVTSDSYVEFVVIGRSTWAPVNNVIFVRDDHATVYDTVIVDDFSFKPLTLSELMAYRNYGRQVSIASPLTLTTGYPGGVVSRLSVNGDGTFNYVHCYHDGVNLHLDTVVNSYTVVSKVNAAAAYGAGRIVKINFSAADTAQAFYNGSQIGADADVSAVPTGTYAGLFLTGAGSLSDPVIT